MSKKHRNHVDDLRGVTRLAIEATQGVTTLVEDMHRTIAGGPAILGKPLDVPMRMVTGLVYGSIQATTGLVGMGIEGALAPLGPWLGKSAPGLERAAVLAAINGVLGDHLEATHNPLAIEMRLSGAAPPARIDAATANPTAAGDGLELLIPVAGDGRKLLIPVAGDGRKLLIPVAGDGRKLLIFVHGLCMTVEQWGRAGRDPGRDLARDLGYEPIYLHYNSGRHISTNGADFSELLERMTDESPQPIDDIVIVGHSMGGLVSRSACHAGETANRRWRSKLRAMIFLGTPHHGSPLEQSGSWAEVLLGVSRYSAPFLRLGRVRSAGITDLRFGNVLDDHWQGRDRFGFAPDSRLPVPLPPDVACYAIAGSASRRAVGRLSSDGLVSVSSALGLHPDPNLALSFPEARTWIAGGMSHLDLLHHPDVYGTMRSWLSQAPDGAISP